MTKYYVFFDKVNNRLECVPKRYRRLRDARQALREYRDKYPKAGACFTLARISNWHICDEWGKSDENWYFVDGEWRKYVNGKRVE